MYTFMFVRSVLVVLLFYLSSIIFPAITDTGLPLKNISNERALLYYTFENINMGDYILCGTHGSVSYGVNTDVLVDDRGYTIKKLSTILPGITKRWSRNQHYDIFNQLLMGTRFLHLEVGWYKHSYVVLHSYYCTTLSDVLDQIIAFLDHTQKGFVVVQLQRWGSIPHDEKHLITYVRAYRNIYYRFGHAQSDKPVTIQKDTFLKNLYGKFIIVQNFQQLPNVAARSTWYDFKHEVRKEIMTFRDPQSSHTRGFAWVMVPNTKTIITKGSQPFNHDGLFSFDSVRRKDFRTVFVHTHYAKIKSCYSFFIMDHVSPGDIDMVDSVNFKLLGA